MLKGQGAEDSASVAATAVFEVASATFWAAFFSENNFSMIHSSAFFMAFCSRYWTMDIIMDWNILENAWEIVSVPWIQLLSSLVKLELIWLKYLSNAAFCRR